MPEGNQGSLEDLKKAEEMLEGQPIQKRLSERRERVAKYMQEIGAKGFIEKRDFSEPTEAEIRRHGKDIRVDELEGIVNGRQFKVRHIQGGSKGPAFEGTVVGVSDLKPNEAQKLFERYSPAAMVTKGFDAEHTFMEAAEQERKEVARTLNEKEAADTREAALHDLLG